MDKLPIGDKYCQKYPGCGTKNEIGCLGGVLTALWPCSNAALFVSPGRSPRSTAASRQDGSRQ
jgi:hypothetical protein